MIDYIDDIRYRGRCAKCGQRVGDKTVEWSKKKNIEVRCFDHQEWNLRKVTNHYRAKGLG